MKLYPLILGMALTIIVVAGYVIDQGGEIRTQQEAQTIAQGAARAGTNAASGTAINGDAFDLAGATAIQTAHDYITAAGPAFTSNVRIQGQQIIVTVHTTYVTRLAGWVGISQLPATGVAAARLIEGTTP